MTKNNVVRSAITKALKQTDKQNATWSKAFLNWKGLGEEFEPFESHRSSLKEPDLSKSYFD